MAAQRSIRPKTTHVVLWGIDHPSQRGDWGISADELKAFRAIICDLAKKHQVAGIAEEMSRDAMLRSAAIGILRRSSLLEDVDLFISQYLQEVPCASQTEIVATKLSLPYVACDLSREEQEKLGPTNWAGYLMQGFSESVAKEKWQAATFPFREREWINRLKAFPHSPVLFLCGDDHLESFSRLLQLNGFSVEFASM